MRLFFLFGLTFCYWVSATGDPSSCASAARLLAQQKAIESGRAPIREERWDKHTPSVSMSSNGMQVNLDSVSSDEQGRRIDTNVVFLRRPDGSWAAHRTVKRGEEVIESKSWVQPTIPLTRETIAEHRIESGPIVSSKLPEYLAAFQKLHGLPDTQVDEAYNELRAKALAAKKPRWLPQEGVVSAVELAFVRMGMEKLASIVQKGARAFGYAPKDVESHLRGRASPKHTVNNQEQSDYVNLMGALRSLEGRGFAFEISGIRTSLLEGLSNSGATAPPP